MDRRVGMEQPDFETIEGLENLSIGDNLFPMLYIYYKGSGSAPNPRYANRANLPMLDAGLRAYLKEVYEHHPDYQGDDKIQDAIVESVNKINSNVETLYVLLDGVGKQNKLFINLLSQHTNTIKNQYARNLPSNIQQKQGLYKTPGNSKYDKVKCDKLPIMDPNTNPDCFGDCMEMFRLLFENGLIPYNHVTGVRPVDLRTGKFADETGQQLASNERARRLGLPTNGILSVNKTGPTNIMFRTFGAIDITMMAVIGDQISELSSATTISWSIHRAKTKVKTLGKTSSSTRSRGARTIAGSMVFVMTNKGALSDLYPKELFNSNTGQDESTWDPVILNDDIPPFDLFIVGTNEYGHGYFMVLYGVEIMDEGTAISTDSPLTEVVFQYTAMNMDPVIEILPDSKGNIDVAGVYSSEYSNYWKRREMAVNGSLNSDLESSYEQWSDSVYQSFKETDKLAKRDAK